MSRQDRVRKLRAFVHGFDTAEDALDGLLAERDALEDKLKAAAKAHFDFDLKSNPAQVLDDLLGEYREDES